jgi:alkanesulfonate monooxygenase SsuD/methylene tetrahydromethanopterin reductase-like flavin-dependent oxidoreductase (luciferase family)
VRLGTICLASFPLRDPIVFGIQWASLDLLSHGRTVLSVCIGGGPQDGPQFAAELDNMGITAPERVGRLVEGVTLLRRLWSEERVTHAGKYYRYTDVALLPKPLQHPVPILIGVILKSCG